MTPHDHWNFLIGTSFLFSFCFSASFDAFWVGGKGEPSLVFLYIKGM